MALVMDPKDANVPHPYLWQKLSHGSERGRALWMSSGRGKKVWSVAHSELEGPHWEIRGDSPSCDPGYEEGEAGQQG